MGPPDVQLWPPSPHAALLLGGSLVAGIAAGFMNTLAGSGSFLTLPALLWMGLPPQIANATNRVGILIAALVAIRTFPKGFGLPSRDLVHLLVPSSLGAASGALVAAFLDPDVMRGVVGWLMLAMLGILLAKPERLLVERDVVANVTGTRNAMLLFAIGAYGGFIQAGVGIFLLAALVLSVHLPLKRANVVKLVIVLVFTLPALLIFIWSDQIRWPIGLFMAGGQSLGAYTAARFASKSERADRFIQRLLIVVLAVTSLKLLLF